MVAFPLKFHLLLEFWLETEIKLPSASGAVCPRPPSILYEFVADIQDHILVTTYTKYVCRRLLLGHPHPSVLDANCQCGQNLSGLHFTDLPASIVRFRRRRVVRRLGLPASRAPAFPEERERERRPEKEGR